MNNNMNSAMKTVGSMVYKHLDVWCFYPCCAAGLYCDKSNRQTQDEKGGKKGGKHHKYHCR